MCLECRNWYITGILIAQSNYSQTQHLSPTHVIESCLIENNFLVQLPCKVQQNNIMQSPFLHHMLFLIPTSSSPCTFPSFLSLLVFLGHAQLRPLVTSCSLRKNIAANVFYMLRGFHFCACLSFSPASLPVDLLRAFPVFAGHGGRSSSCCSCSASVLCDEREKMRLDWVFRTL